MTTENRSQTGRRSKPQRFALAGALALGVAFAGLGAPTAITAHASGEVYGNSPTIVVGPAANRAAFQFNSPLDEVALNPQPLPPRSYSALFRALRGPADHLGEVGLNPQPLPPRVFVR
jgi:hypothetical protein